MELNIVATPVESNKFNRTNKNKQHNNKQNKKQQSSNEFSFTFNKNDKVSATVAGIKKQGHVIKTVKNTVNNNEGGTKRVVKKYLPSIKSMYSAKPQEKPLDADKSKTVDQNSKQTPETASIHKNVSTIINVENDKVSSKGKRKANKKIGKPNDSNEQSKVSSLFGHNPDVPTVGQRLVNPVIENVFSGKEVSSLKIHAHSVKNIKDLLNITELTTVQGKTIPVLLDGRDALVRSQTGSGKTLAYGLPIVEKLQAIRPKITRNQGVLALIVVPTRELAIQTYELFVKLLKPFTWIVPGYLIGGENRKSEKARLRKGINILIGTPGRLCDHLIHSSNMKLGSVRWLVLDEADRLLELGYERDVKEIVQSLSNQKSISWYDPVALMKQAIEKNVKTGVHKKFEDIEKEVKEVKKENDDDDEEFDDDDEETSEDEEDSSKSKIKKHRGIVMFQGTQKSLDDSNKSASIKKEELDSKESLDQTTSVSESKPQTNDALQTVLLSATLTPAVEKLAGLALREPIFIETSEMDDSKKSKNSTVEDIISIPASVVQSYILVPPKLRLVTLTGIIVNECRKKQNSKILVFVATQDLVDYHRELMQEVLGEQNSDSEDEEDDLCMNCDVTFFKLHGSMTQQERTKVFKEFRAAKTGVLFCTDVAARGLDVPAVSLVVQYTPPTSAADYAHRVGRTARAGRSGRAIILLSPHEVDYVRALEDRRIRLSQDTLESSLEALLTPRSPNIQAAATVMQQKYEENILENENLMRMACKAFFSWTRFYSAFPGEWKHIFNIRLAHTGHYAKSFALRQAPGSHKLRQGAESSNTKERPKNRLTRERDPDELKKEKAHASGGQRKMTIQKRGMSMQARQRQLVLSEYDSGLPPLKKKKKN